MEPVTACAFLRGIQSFIEVFSCCSFLFTSERSTDCPSTPRAAGMVTLLELWHAVGVFWTSARRYVFVPRALFFLPLFKFRFMEVCRAMPNRELVSLHYFPPLSFLFKTIVTHLEQQPSKYLPRFTEKGLGQKEGNRITWLDTGCMADEATALLHYCTIL